MTPTEQFMNMGVFKIFFRLKDMIFGKYYDPKIYKDLNVVKQSSVFPADMILISGQLIADESILTGEQAAQIKEPISELKEDKIQPFNSIYAGTRLIQIQADEVKLLVTRTASQTEQGKLIKTIAFNEERMNITTKDSVFFLFIMFIVATVSSVYAFHRGYKNKVCKITRLILETLMIFTSVIPPDLPSELSMCIGNAIRTLRNQSKVFSTEPYRILNAGRVKFICFDKSGTLTQSNIKVLGVDETLAEPNVKTISSRVSSKNELIDCTDISRMVIVGCQSIS